MPSAGRLFSLISCFFWSPVIIAWFFCNSWGLVCSAFFLSFFVSVIFPKTLIFISGRIVLVVFNTITSKYRPFSFFRFSTFNTYSVPCELVPSTREYLINFPFFAFAATILNGHFFSGMIFSYPSWHQKSNQDFVLYHNLYYLLNEYLKPVFNIINNISKILLKINYSLFTIFKIRKVTHF